MCFISIEGNIGAGKSTLVELIKEVFDEIKVEFVQEPVDEWLTLTDENGHNILEIFYNNKKRWAYSFQMNALITRLKRLEKALEYNDLVICERTVETDKNCFAKELYDSKCINNLEWKLYNQWYNWLIEKTPSKPSGIIYLECSPTICNERIKKRERKEESSIPIEYLNNIHQKHEDWISNYKLNNNIPILTLDVNPDYDVEPEYKNIVLKRVRDFIINIIEII